MSKPLSSRTNEEWPVETPPSLQVLPSPELSGSGGVPPPLIPGEPVFAPPSAATACGGSFPPQNGGNFLSPEEVDLMAGFEEQAALESATASHVKGFLGGALAALACTLVAGIFSALSGRWYGFFSMGIGFAVAYGVRKWGKGNSAQFGLIGATWALLGCLGAYHLANVIVMAREEGVPILEFVQGIESWGGFMQDVLGPKDFVFYAIAAFFGYTRSHDAVADRY